MKWRLTAIELIAAVETVVRAVTVSPNVDTLAVTTRKLLVAADLKRWFHCHITVYHITR